MTNMEKLKSVLVAKGLIGETVSDAAVHALHSAANLEPGTVFIGIKHSLELEANGLIADVDPHLLASKYELTPAGRELLNASKSVAAEAQESTVSESPAYRRAHRRLKDL